MRSKSIKTWGHVYHVKLLVDCDEEIGSKDDTVEDVSRCVRSMLTYAVIATSVHLLPPNVVLRPRHRSKCPTPCWRTFGCCSTPRRHAASCADLPVVPQRAGIHSGPQQRRLSMRKAGPSAVTRTLCSGTTEGVHGYGTRGIRTCKRSGAKMPAVAPVPPRSVYAYDTPQHTSFVRSIGSHCGISRSKRTP